MVGHKLINMHSLEAFAVITQRRILKFLKRAKSVTARACRCDLFLSILIVVNLIAVCLETIDSLFLEYKTIFVAVELVSVSIFSIEYVLRIWSRPAASDEYGKTATSKRLGYIFSFTGIIDLLAILPSILPLLLGGVDLRWLRILRLMRLLKFSHYSSALEDLFSAVQHERRSFAATLYLLILAILISSSLIYVFEQNVQPEHFGSIPDAMWWTVVTLTTVGYGDIVPMTVAWKTCCHIDRADGGLCRRITYWYCCHRIYQSGVNAAQSTRGRNHFSSE